MMADDRTLSTKQRLKLSQTLNALPSVEFEQILFSLSPSSGTVPTSPAAQGARANALLQWAQGPTGCGLSTVIKLLREVAGAAVFTSDPPQAGRPLRVAPEPRRVFTGRESLLTEIHQTLAAGELVALSGLGGIGKTALLIVGMICPPSPPILGGTGKSHSPPEYSPRGIQERGI